ncbi:CRE-SPE-9 protein [Caenorhabditis remanei]|uniref:CRE-SPE-9 protein n=1 Tax=Caenorhabditis remanei TaxID=31234 RepID=E3N9X8_CAERE|nr:CRE-SPE-9 protein [Caenorhabditis remanei]
MNLIILVVFLFSSVSGAKIRKLIDFLEKDAPNDIEKAPNYNEESVAFRRNKNFNPCLENRFVCSNNGKCLSEDGNFYCVCPVTHYGKTCEHVADQSKCERNLCQNNSTCVSIQTKKTIVNTVLLKSLRLTKGANSPLTDKELSDIDMEVEYECICQKGTFGGLCDESDVDRKCQEVYCLGRGKGTVDQNGTCHCECEKQFFGERCEQLSACFDTQCQNGGVCEDVVDWQTKTVTATCKCPQTLEIIGGTVTGENCENLKIPDTIPAELVPCAAGRNSSYFFENLIDQINIDFGKDIGELDAIQNDYHDGETKNGKMDSGWCKNDGKCVAEVVRVQTSRAYYIHRCECPNRLTDGYYCEYKRHDACSLTREEVARGARWDEKCTDSQHGACVDINGEATCVCKPDYTGETCEVFDPCARHPCKHGDCIPIPSSADVAFGTNRFQCLCPLSAKLDTENNDCVEINEKKCAKGVCGNGRCVPCDSDIPSADDLMPLCNPNEKAQGFRCLCESGYLPPFCKIHTNPCYHNLCQNSGTCRVDPKTRSYDCQCLNGTRGSLCETIDDSCDAFGSKICVHGVCVNDAYFHRGFSCECVEGFEGFDCDVAVGWSSVWYSRFERNYQYTGPLLACLLSLIVMFPLILMSRRRRDEASLAPTSSSEGTKVEEGKSMNI